MSDKPTIVNVDQKVDIQEIEDLAEAEFLQGDESGCGYCGVFCC